MKRRMDCDMETEAVEPDLPIFGRWLGVKLLDQVLQVLLGAANALLRVAEL